MLVVDASALLRGLLRESGWEEVFRVLAGEPLIAPELVVAEVGTALWRRVRMGAMAPDDAREAVAALPAAFARLAPLAPLRAQALDLALRRDHPVCDGFYVALAMREGLPLVTADRRLAERFAQDAAVRVLG